MADARTAVKRKLRSFAVLLVDGLNVMLRQFWAYPDLRSPSGIPTGAIFGVVNRIREAVDRFAPSRVIVCWDGGRSAWRRAVFAWYKDRPRSESRADLSECFAQREPLRELLEQMGCDQVEVEGVEADDLIAWFAQGGWLPSDPIVKKTPIQGLFYVRHGRGVCNVDHGDFVILSSDRDFYQLVDAHTSVYLGVSAGKGRAVEHVTLETFHEATMSAKLPNGVADPGEWAAYRVVNGDASDNIPSVRGLGGEKRWPSVYGTLLAMGYAGNTQDCFLGRDEVGVAGSFGAAVVESWNLLERNTILMDLNFAVGMLEQKKIDPAKALVVGRWDERAFEIACSRYAFWSALQDWGAWRGTFRGLAERRNG